jgi:hypothetical protein
MVASTYRNAGADLDQAWGQPHQYFLSCGFVCVFVPFFASRRINSYGEQRVAMVGDTFGGAVEKKTLL